MKNKRLAIFGLVDLLLRLRRSKAGNTLAMVAAGLVPLTAMIGSGVDISRAYMVQSRLQQACDAGVLAGRKAMADGEYTTAAKAVADDYFEINYPTGYIETTNSTFTSSNPAGGSTVIGSASVTVPTVVMSMFNFDSLDIAVNCTAQLEIANSDITFVLDNTGSMACPENSNSSECLNYFIANGSVPIEGVAFGGLSLTSRLQALKDAMDGFYNTIDEAASNSGARVRYAFVPYSQTVNVGYLLPSAYIVDEHTYQSSEYFITEYFRSQNSLYTSNCGGFFGNWPGHRVYGRFDSTYNGCIWDEDRIYRAVTFDVSDYKTGTSVRDPSTRTNDDYIWAGCIEERDTVGTSTIAFDPASGQISPAGLFDLDIDSAPISDATRWRPYWPEVSLRRRHGQLSTTDLANDVRDPQVACPARSASLTEYATLSNFQDYHATLIPDGGTYHDIGLLWGARVSSAEGIFASTVNEEPSNGGFVGRHIVWMSDGDLGVSDSAYTAYGIERHDGRITGNPNGGSGTFGAQLGNVETRYTELCKAIKAKGIRLWVVAFNTALTTELTTCASPNSSFVANNSTELSQRFATIAEQIAELRLTE